MAKCLDDVSIIGYCVLTVGTDAKISLKIAGVKLLPSHDYAVVGQFLVWVVTFPIVNLR